MTISPGSFVFGLILGLTIFIMVVQAGIFVYLGRRILEKRKEKEIVSFDFIFGVFLLILFLLIARIFYSIFDFYYTQFDQSLYYISPNIWFWKMGEVFTGIGPAILIFIIDKKILGFKFKGILSYILIAGIIAGFVYPVSNTFDFQMVSSIGLISGFGAAIIPIIFIYIASKSTGEVKKIAILILVGFILYIVGSLLVLDNLVTFLVSLYGSNMQIVLYITSTGLKSIGLIIFSFGATKFKI